jgi:hypothetical protein
VVESQNPGQARLSDDNLKNKGQLLLDDYFDAFRERVAGKWFYYRNMPNEARLPLFAFNVELQAWAFWILSQKWELKVYADSDPYMPTIYNYSNGEFGIDEITMALEELAEEEIVEVERSGIVDGADEFAAAVKLEKAAIMGHSRLSDGDGAQLKQLNKNKEQIFAWAKSVPGQVDHPVLEYIPRALGSIRGMKRVFPSIQ